MNVWIQGEALGFFTPLLKLSQGELPSKTDFVSMVAPQTAVEIVTGFLDLIKYMIDELGFKPEGSTKFAQLFNYKKFPGQTLDDIGKNLNSYYRNTRLISVNANNPYYKKIENMKKWEKKYLKTTNNPKVEILTGNEMSPYNSAFIKLFEQSNDYKAMANALIDKYWAHKHLYMKGGLDPDAAAKNAMKEVKAIVKRQDPLSIGLEDDDRWNGYSKNDQFIFFLVQSALDQGKTGEDALVHVDEFFKVRRMYNERVDSVKSNYEYILRTTDDLKKEDDLKYLKQFYPSEWDDIGIKVKDGQIYLDFDGGLKKTIYKKYGKNLFKTKPVLPPK